MERSPEINKIIENYRQFVGAYNGFADAMRVRTVGEAWRIDGVGSCNITRRHSEENIIGPAVDNLIHLREQRNMEIGGEVVDDPDIPIVCPYHRKGVGCVLGDLKGPLCVSHVEGNHKEIEDRFGIGADALSGWVLGMSVRILVGKIPECQVNDAVEVLGEMRDYVEGFPILGEEEFRGYWREWMVRFLQQ